MPIYRGLDISAKVWRLSQGNIDPNGWFKFTPLQELLDGDRFFLQDLGKRLELDEKSDEKMPVFSSPGAIVERLRPQTNSYSEVLRQNTQALGSCNKVGVAFPYAVSPPIRQVLPELLGKKDVASQRRLGLECPMAACLELVATGAIPCPKQPKTLLFLGETDRGAELTALRVVANEKQLSMDVLAWREIQAEPPETEWANWPPELFAAGAAEPIDLCVIHSSLQQLGQEVAKALGISREATRFLEADAAAAARGVARYAAIEEQGYLLVDDAYDGSRIEELKIQRILPRPLGIIGANGAGKQFWRLLFAGGTLFGTSAASELVIEMEHLPTFFAFAVVTRCMQSPPSWLPQSAWRDYGLQLFALRTNPGNIPAKRKTLRISLQSIPLGPVAWNDKVLDLRVSATPGS